jgi:hypothetical protein
MSSGAVVCWVALLLWLAAPPALPFNLETRLPLVKYGADGVYFGFSVAEHQTVNYITNASTVGDSWSVFFYLFLYCLLFLFCCCVRLCQLISAGIHVGRCKLSSGRECVHLCRHCEVSSLIPELVLGEQFHIAD